MSSDLHAGKCVKSKHARSKGSPTVEAEKSGVPSVKSGGQCYGKSA